MGGDYVGDVRLAPGTAAAQRDQQIAGPCREPECREPKPRMPAKRPQASGAGRLAAGQLAVVAAVYRSFSRSAAEFLSTLTRTSVQLRLESLQPLRWREMRSRCDPPAAIAGLVLDPLPGTALLVVDRPLAFSLIDRLLGGRGDPAVPARALSEIERTVLQSGLAAVLPELQQAWEPVRPVTPHLAYLERRTDRADLLAPATRLVGATFSAAIGSVAGVMLLAVGEPALWAIRDRLARHRSLPPSRPAVTPHRDGATMTVELAANERVIRDLLAGAGGAAVGLDRFAGEQVAIAVDRQPVARGEVVPLNGDFGIRVTEILGANAYDRGRSEETGLAR